MTGSSVTGAGYRIPSHPVPANAVELTWLGQSAFILRVTGTTVLIDPYLTERADRLTPPPFRPEEGTGFDIIACTHDHSDHFDRESIAALAAASPGAVIVVPAHIATDLPALGVAADRVVGVQPGAPVKIAGITLHTVPASHGMKTRDAYNFGAGETSGVPHYVGFVFEMGGAHIYHSGDTIVYDGMIETLQAIRVDVALLPINGRDYFREQRDLVGNMDHREAAEVANQIGTDLLVPMHYDMFEANLGYPEALVQVVRQRAPNVSVFVPALNRPFLYTRPGA